MNVLQAVLVVALLGGDGADAAADRVALEKQCRDLGERIEKSMNAGDSSVVDATLDLDAIVDAAVRDIDADAETQARIRTGVKSNLKSDAVVKSIVADHGAYKFLRIRWVGDEPHALFRLLVNGGANYHEFYLVPSKGGSIRARDKYIYASGETMSEALHRSAVQVAALSKVPFLERLSGPGRDLTQRMVKVVAFQKQVTSGAFDEGLASYRALAESDRRDKTNMFLWVAAAMRANSAEYPKAVEEFERAFPDDRAIDINGISAFFQRKDWERLHRSINRLDERVGGDAWLDFVRGNAYIAEGDVAKAKGALHRAIDTEPTLPNPYWTLVSISLTEKNNAEIARLLDQLEKECGVTIRKDLDQAADYVDFVKSDEYRAWQTSHAKKD